MSLPAQFYPKPPANLEPYVRVLGPQLTIAFLIRFGGAELYAARNSPGRSKAVQLIGPENMHRLRDVIGTNRIPLGNRWLAAALFAEGHSTAEIARRLRATDYTVRGWLRTSQARIKAGKRA